MSSARSALPVRLRPKARRCGNIAASSRLKLASSSGWGVVSLVIAGVGSNAAEAPRKKCRSEEHTSELQSLMRISYAVFCLKKKKITHTTKYYDIQNDHANQPTYNT